MPSYKGGLPVAGSGAPSEGAVGGRVWGDMPFLELKREILDHDMCTRCGACAAVCPPGLLEMGDEGLPVPMLAPEAMPCNECSLCLDVCPGKDTATPRSETRIFGRSRTPQERWTGIFRQSLVLTSTNPRVLSSACTACSAAFFASTIRAAAASPSSSRAA